MPAKFGTGKALFFAKLMGTPARTPPTLQKYYVNSHFTPATPILIGFAVAEISTTSEAGYFIAAGPGKLRGQFPELLVPAKNPSFA